MPVPDHDRRDLCFSEPLPCPTRAEVFNHHNRHVATLYGHDRQQLEGRAQRFCGAIGRGWAQLYDAR